MICTQQDKITKFPPSPPRTGNNSVWLIIRQSMSLVIVRLWLLSNIQFLFLAELHLRVVLNLMVLA